jgi:hypothetical protein
LPDRGGVSVNVVNQAVTAGVAVPANGSADRLLTMDEEVIEMSRQLEGPFPVKE